MAAATAARISRCSERQWRSVATCWEKAQARAAAARERARRSAVSGSGGGATSDDKAAWQVVVGGDVAVAVVGVGVGVGEGAGTGTAMSNASIGAIIRLSTAIAEAMTLGGRLVACRYGTVAEATYSSEAEPLPLPSVMVSVYSICLDILPRIEIVQLFYENPQIRNSSSESAKPK